MSQGYFLPNEFLKISEGLQSGQQRDLGSSVEALIIRMFTMAGRPRETERDRERETERQKEKMSE